MKVKRGIKTYLKTISLSHSGYSVSEIANKLKLNENTVKRYLRNSKKGKRAGSILAGTVIHLPNSFSVNMEGKEKAKA